jgi:hypothetical protein
MIFASAYWRCHLPVRGWNARVSRRKLVDCFPVVNFKRFFDSRPNGTSIMNVGACIPKKRMEDFVELALRVPELECNLYALG